jgi:HPt (histidine-containing phosphotransfer) domain-containing protein
VTALRAAVEGGDAVAVHQIAHTLKGALASLHASAALALAQELEARGRAGDVGDAGPLVERLAAEVGRVIDFFTRPDWVDSS